MLKIVLLLAAVVALSAALFLRRRKPQPRRLSKELPLRVLTDSGPAPTKSLGRAEVLRKLHELAFNGPIGDVPAEHAKVEREIVAALPSAAAEPRYAPRRPMLLPQLLQALGAAETSRRELADIIARDPSLVGSLLKMANSPFYRASEEPVESIEHAIAVMGTQGVRSLVAAALMQPMFRASSAAAGRFPEVVWEHSYYAGAAAETYAKDVENDDPFVAQLLAMVTGLATIVVFRVATDQYVARGLPADSAALATLLAAQTPYVARQIAGSWGLSDRALEALDEQLPGRPVRPASALGRSLRFAGVAGALLVLFANDVIDEETGLASLAAAGGSGPKFKSLWTRFARSIAAERAA